MDNMTHYIKCTDNNNNAIVWPLRLTLCGLKASQTVSIKSEHFNSAVVLDLHYIM